MQCIEDNKKTYRFQIGKLNNGISKKKSCVKSSKTHSNYESKWWIEKLIVLFNHCNNEAHTMFRLIPGLCVVWHVFIFHSVQISWDQNKSIELHASASASCISKWMICSFSSFSVSFSAWQRHPHASQASLGSIRVEQYFVFAEFIIIYFLLA